MKKVERSFMIDEDAAEILVQLAGGPRKQGEYLSDLIREKAQQDPLLTRIADLERELARLRVAVVQREQRDETEAPGSTMPARRREHSG